MTAIILIFLIGGALMGLYFLLRSISRPEPPAPPQPPTEPPPSEPPPPPPEPPFSVPMGYYFALSPKFGDWLGEVGGYTDLYVASASSFQVSSDELPDIWLPRYKGALRAAARQGMWLYLGMELSSEFPTGRYLRGASDLWTQVRLLELADEPPWDRQDTLSWISFVRDEEARLGLLPRPKGVIYQVSQILHGPTVWEPLDWVGLECYLEPSDDPPAECQRRLVSRVTLMAEIVAPKPVVLVGQAYARNPRDPQHAPNGPFNFENMSALDALQEPVYWLAKSLGERCLAITWFSYGRLSGTRHLRELGRVRLDERHRAIWERMHPGS